MKPIYDFFVDSQNKLDEYSEKKKEYIKEHPELNMWSDVEGITMDEILVMNSLIPHDEEYDQIKESGQYLVNPQQAFYGTKWDFTFEESNIYEISEECIKLSPSTAWSPPTEFCEKLAKKYDVTINLQYEEGGVGFVGKELFTNEGMVEQEFYDDYYEGLYRLDVETFWSMVESELEDTDFEETTEEEFLNKFPYVDDVDRKQLQEDYQEYLNQD
jgi:hypothetical protein